MTKEQRKYQAKTLEWLPVLREDSQDRRRIYPNVSEAVAGLTLERWDSHDYVLEQVQRACYRDGSTFGFYWSYVSKEKAKALGLDCI